MSTTRINDKQSVRCPVHPDAVFLLKLSIDTQRIIRGIANLEYGGRFEERTRQEKTQERYKPGAEKSTDSAPRQAPSPLVDLAVVRANTRHSCGRGCFRRTYRRRSHVAGCKLGVRSSGLPGIHFRFVRLNFLARQAIPPGWLNL